MNQYKLRKDLDRLTILAEQTRSDVNVLNAITLDGNEYYTKDDVDDMLARLRAKSEGLPYFFTDDDSNLVVDLPLSADFSFSLNGDCELVVSLPEGVENHFVLLDNGDLVYRVEGVGLSG